MEKDTFIFDLDGTLLDTLPDLVVVTNTALRQMGFPERTPEQILSYVGNGARALVFQAIPQDVDDRTAQRTLEAWKAVHASYGHNLTKPYPRITEILEEMKRRGARLGILSNKFDGGVQAMQQRFFPQVISVAHGECASIPRKPDPTGLLRTIDELGSTPSRAVYVGDSPGDIVVARNAGCFALGVAWGYRSRADLEAEAPDALIDRTDQLLDLCKA